MARDLFHNHVKQALINDGWTITHDPYRLSYLSARDLEIDLGAERTVIAATKETEGIAVEVKSFLSDSFIHDLYKAIGQYIVYKTGLQLEDAARKLYLAIPEHTYQRVFNANPLQELLRTYDIRLLVVDIPTQTITRWIP